MDFKIAIPTYNREKTIKEKTLKTLSSYDITLKDIDIFVANEQQAELYLKSLGDCNIVIGELGIGKQRNFIEKFYPEGTKLIQVDDDIQGFYRFIDKKTLKPLNDLVNEFFIKGFSICEKKKLKCFGYYGVFNPFFMSNKIKFDLCYILGVCFGVIVEHSEFLERTTEHGEDYEYSIRQYIKNDGLVRFENITCKTNYCTEKGGLQDTRTQENVNNGIKQILRTFPNYCKLREGKKLIKNKIVFPNLILKDKRKIERVKCRNKKR